MTINRRELIENTALIGITAGLVTLGSNPDKIVKRKAAKGIKLSDKEQVRYDKDLGKFLQQAFSDGIRSQIKA